MLQYTIAAGRFHLHCIIISFPDSYAICMVIGDTGFIGSASAALSVLGKPLGKIPAETIQFIFCKPMLHHTAGEITGSQTLMVKIIEYIIRMRCRYVEPWIICSRLISSTVPI